MKIVKPLTLGVMHKPYQFQGQNYFAVAAIGFFRLGAPNERFLTENLQWPQVLASLPKGQALDESMPKQHAEALLLGSAFCPDTKPCAEMQVRLCAAGIDKRLRVTGEREWRYGLLPSYRVSKPKPFASMPLVYERAFGGAGHPANPVGRGYSGNRLAALVGKNHGAMPNIERVGETAGPHWKRSAPAGFGPLRADWTPRKGKFGTYGKKWLEQDAPGFARDIDWSVFNLAPPDQWNKEFFKGGETYCLENLHPKKPVIAGALPALQARAFMLQNGQDTDSATEIALRMDTVWFLPEHELGVVIYHGQTKISDSDALDVAALMVGYEDAAEPKSVAHYREVLALRLGAETAALHVFDESQLAAERSLPEQARRAGVQRKAEADDLAKRQHQLDLMDAEFWAQHPSPPPPDYQAPRAKPPEFGLMTPEMVAECDFDLTATMQHAKDLGAAAQKKGDAAMEDLKKRQAELAPPSEPETIDPAQKIEQAALAAIERAAIPAYDLLPAAETGTDPRLAQLLDTLEQAHANGQLDAAQHEKAKAAVLQTPALRRQARRAAPTSTVAELPLMPEAALQLGQQIKLWQMSGICLAGRDLAGANLAGCDFSGADLRQVMLEGANLAQANFSGANLEGAVLTGACLDGANFSNANLSQANLCNSAGKAVRFKAAKLSRAQAISANWPRADLSGANLDDMIAPKLGIKGAVLDDISAKRTTLLEAQADDSSWQRASMEKVILMRSSLQRADFRAAQLFKTVLIEAQMQDSQWDRASWHSVQGTGKSDWRRASLVGVRAENCGLHGTLFAAADFRGAQFMHCDFGKADLQGAKLDDGVFSYSLFLQTNLRCVSARRADFLQAMCRKADFCGADLADASFAQCELSESIGTDGKTDVARRAA